MPLANHAVRAGPGAGYETGSAATIMGPLHDARCLLPCQFAVLLALVFAKIARIDYPRYWPSLMEDLLAVTAEGDGLRRRRAYLMLHHVLKELSSKRLSADQRTFAEVGLKSHRCRH